MYLADTGRDLSNAGGESVRQDAVAVLLCTFNGTKFLQEQLASLTAQTHSNWRLIVSDDGSTDDTLAILAQYQASSATGNRVDIRQGTHRGAMANFMRLVGDPNIEADYVAYCDQDDIWRADKLERALAWLGRIPMDVPAMYGSRTRVVSHDGRPTHMSPRFRKPASFRNALVQSLVGGNTIVMNKAAHSLLVRAGPLEVVSHDWWTYLLVSGAGGAVLYDPDYSVDYRQHSQNQIGSNRGISASLRRLRSLLRGQLMDWNTINTAALTQCEHLLTDENRRLLHSFCALRSASLTMRVKLWREIGLYRQTRLGDFGTLLALMTGNF